jgi:YVTN family beta-propeller protein
VLANRNRRNEARRLSILVRRLVGLAVAVLLSSLAASNAAVDRSDPAPPLAFAPVRMLPVSARVVARCRSIQTLAGERLLCPTLLPHATAGGIPDVPPRALSVTPIGDFFRRRVAGIDIAYGAPWEGRGWRAHRWRNRPCCFFHFDLFRRAPGRAATPKGARPATLGGKHGLLVRAHEGAYYGNGLYWANHVRFLWHEHGTNWVATLHTFGEAATERLLGRLIATLRPVNSIRPAAQGAIPVGVTPNAIASANDSLWVAALGDLTSNFRGTVYRVDATSGRVTARAHPVGGGGPHALALLDGSLWVATYNGIARIDPRTARRTAFLNVGRFPRGIAAAAGLLWVADATPFGKNGSLVSVDPRTDHLVGRAVPLGRSPGTIAACTGSLWATDELDRTVTRIDPRRRRVIAVIRVGWMPTAVACDAGAVWVANTGAGTVSRIDAATNRVTATVSIGLAPRALAAGKNSVWVAATGDGTVRRIDPLTRRVSTVLRGLAAPLALALSDGTLWVTTNEGELIRLRP